MRKILLPLCLVCSVLAAVLIAADLYPGGAKQVTFSWNPVTQYEGGTPCTPTGYEVAIWTAGVNPNVLAPGVLPLAAMTVPPGTTQNVDITALFTNKLALDYTLSVRTLDTTHGPSLWASIPITFGRPQVPSGLKYMITFMGTSP